MMLMVRTSQTSRIGRLSRVVVTPQQRRSFSSPPVRRTKRMTSTEQTFVHGGDAPIEEITEVSDAVVSKNFALAFLLLAFCGGVGFYSMNAVGQAGTGEDDPLAALRQEAAAAQEKQDRENMNDAEEIIKQFQAGDFDPDKYEELEEELENSKQRPWWKFW